MMVLESMDHSFAGNIGFSNILHAEFMLVYHDLVLVWGLDIKELLCYSDFKTVIKLILTQGAEYK
jgi:hypothetical protein